MLDDGSRREVDAMCDIRQADMLEARRFSMVRLPLADGAWFYAMLPNGGLTVRDIRSEFSSTKIDEILTVMKSVTVSGVSHGPVALVGPWSPKHYLQRILYVKSSLNP